VAEFPWFPCYPSDWLSSKTVQLLTLNEEAAFFRLLCYAWLEDACALLSNAQALQTLAKWPQGDDFSRVLACFKPHPTKPDHLHNPRLYKEWLLARARQDMLQTRAHKGAEARWAEKPKKTYRLKSSPLQNGRDYRDEAKQILAFLNEKTIKHFRPVDANLSLIEARLKSGVDLQTCKSLIARKVRDWTPDPLMHKYLRPETLFGKTKFETYLAEVTP
jgi:uncharacterized phage protein (TIGR02220 family)